MAIQSKTGLPNSRESSRQPKSRSASAPVQNFVAVARGAGMVIIRVVGRGNMVNAPALQEFADEQRSGGYMHFLFDFTHCTGLDSTFMGVMVGLHTPESDSHPVLHAFDLEKAECTAAAGERVPLSPEEALAEMAGAPNAGKAKGSTVSVVNCSAELRALLGMLGVDEFVNMHGACDLSRLEVTPLPEKLLGSVERRQLIYKAHETLVEIDKRNEAQFGDLLNQISKELGTK
jgi:anti-anti-sigma regulatory factor